MIPTSTGAAKALHLVIPELKGKLDGYAMRVPTPNVSVVDLTVITEKPATVASRERGAESRRRRADEGHPANTPKKSWSRSISAATRIRRSWMRATRASSATNCVKVLAWYDNEWGYSCRCRDLIKFLACATILSTRSRKSCADDAWRIRDSSR